MKHLTMPSPAPRTWRDIPQRKGVCLTRVARRFARWVDGLRKASGDRQRIEAPRPQFEELCK